MIDPRILLGIHELLTTIGCLVLLPFGVWMSTIGKHRCPENWFCLHMAYMSSALFSIITATGITWSITEPTYNHCHALLGPILVLLLIAQALGGVVMASVERGDERPFINKIHKSLGLVLYLAALVNGFLGLYMYSTRITDHKFLYAMIALMGSLGTMNFYILIKVLPTWITNWWSDPEYEFIADDHAAAEAAVV